jgi:hypothetical protein
MYRGAKAAALHPPPSEATPGLHMNIALRSSAGGVMSTLMLDTLNHSAVGIREQVHSQILKCSVDGICELAHSQLSGAFSVVSLSKLPAGPVLAMGTSSSPSSASAAAVDDKPLAGVGGADNDQARLPGQAVGGVDAVLELESSSIFWWASELAVAVDTICPGSTGEPGAACTNVWD